MTSLAVPAQAATAVAVVPTPACIQPRRAPAGEVPGRDMPGASQAPAAVATGAGPVAGGPASDGAAGADAAGARRGTTRQLLDAALAGVRLGGRDRQFLARLVHWDKRNAASVASLLERAQEAGREAARTEGGLTPRQLQIVIAALGDAAVYRASGAAATSCWDCEMVRGGRCADHARDFDRASAYADLASALSVPGTPADGAADLHRPARERPRDLTEYRHRAAAAS
jgi:hypothetical protein